MLNPGLAEISLLAILVLILFGSGKVNAIARCVGRCVASFRQGERDVDVIDITPDSDE